MKQKRSLWQSVASVFKDTSPFMTKVERVALLAELNLCFLLTALPLVTAGAALTALHTALSRFSTLTYGSAFRLYLRTFVRALRPTFLPWLLTLAAGGALTAGWYTALRFQLTDRFPVMLPLLLSGAVVLFTALWLYPLCAKELAEASALRTKELLSAALLLGLRELLRSFAALGTALLSLLFLLWAAATSLTAVGLWFLFGVSPFALLQSKIVTSVILPDKNQ